MQEAFLPNLPGAVDAVLTEDLLIADRRLTLRVSAPGSYPDYGPNVHVIRVWVVHEDETPLTLLDLRPGLSRQVAYTAWSELCDLLSAAAKLAYGLRDSSDGVPNPRLGCWGPRPDLADLVEDDRATALIIGVAVDVSQAVRQGEMRIAVLALRSAVVGWLKSWGTESPPTIPADRVN